MEIKQAIEILELHNKWRRGEDEDIEMVDVAQLGIAIGTIIGYVNEKI